MKILIIGAGIAGSTLALALHAAGMEAEIAEARSRDDNAGGAFLTLAPNGVNALRTLGLDDVPQSAGGYELSGLDFHNATGRRIARIDGRDDQARYGARGMLLRRSALQAELAARAAAVGTVFHYDARLVELTDRSDGVQAVFADGRVIDADIVIGADGIWSTVRRLTWPDAPKPEYTGIVDCGGWTPVPLPDSTRQQMYFGRRAFFGYAVRDATAYWFTNVPREDEPRRGELDHLDQDRWMSEIRSLHVRDPQPVRTVLEATESSLGAWPVYDLRSLRSWNTEKVCLIGDAAHATSPSSGQGASLAIEDAVVLAQALRASSTARTPGHTGAPGTSGIGTPGAAFDAYVRERKPRAERIVQFGRRIGDRKITSTASSIFRDLTLRFFLRMGAKATTEQYSYQPTWDATKPTDTSAGDRLPRG